MGVGFYLVGFFQHRFVISMLNPLAPSLSSKHSISISTHPHLLSQNGIDGGTCGVTGCSTSGGWQNFCAQWNTADCAATYLSQLQVRVCCAPPPVGESSRVNSSSLFVVPHLSARYPTVVRSSDAFRSVRHRFDHLPAGDQRLGFVLARLSFDDERSYQLPAVADRSSRLNVLGLFVNLLIF